MSVLRWLPLTLVLSTSVHCAKTDKAWCTQQLSAARARLESGQLNEAERVITEAYSRCRAQGGAEVKALRDELSARRLLLRRTTALQAEAHAEQERRKYPSLDFAHWALEHRGALPEELSAPSCAERGTPDFGFCDATRSGQPHMRVRYWEKSPAAIRFSLQTTEPVSCQDVGEHRELPSWTHQGKRFTLCELTERRFRHLSVLLVVGTNNEMYVFAREYLQHDKDFERQVAPAGAPK